MGWICRLGGQIPWLYILNSHSCSVCRKWSKYFQIPRKLTLKTIYIIFIPIYSYQHQLLTYSCGHTIHSQKDFGHANHVPPLIPVSSNSEFGTKCSQVFLNLISLLHPWSSQLVFSSMHMASSHLNLLFFTRAIMWSSIESLFPYLSLSTLQTWPIIFLNIHFQGITIFLTLFYQFPYYYPIM